MRRQGVRTIRRVTSALQRDGLRTQAGDEDRQLELCQIMWSVRHVALVVGIVVEAARHAGWQETAVVGAALLWQLFAHLTVRRHRSATLGVTAADAALLVGLAVAGLPVPLVLVTSVCVLGWAVTFRPLPAVLVATAALVAACVGAARSGLTTPMLEVLGPFVMLGAIFVVRAVRMNLGARQAAERERLVADGIDAILWETVPGDDSPTSVGSMKVSAAAERILGYPTSAWAAPGFLSLIVHPDERTLLDRRFAERSPDSSLFRLRRQDGEYRWMELRPTWLRDRARHDFAVGILLDRTEQVAAEQARADAGVHLHRLARQDDLTGLPNRRAFLEFLEDAGSGDRSCRAVALLDLDDFKDINDALGHEMGDQLLQRIGASIVEHLAGAGIVSRLGGDEFALVLGGEDLEDAIALVRRIVDAINEPMVVGDLRLRVRASAGVVPIGPASVAQTPLQLLRCADVAMYTAKARSSGVSVYDVESDMIDRTRLELGTALDAAIRDDQLVLHHQPLVDVRTGRVVGTEALARWQHPTLGLVGPDRFIDLAEVSGHIRQLTRWVVRRALEDLLALGDAGAGLDVSVNLSVRNLYEVDLVDWIAATLEGLGVGPERLVVEITESTVMDDQPAAIKVIEELRALGVRVWIDDFGTGHSSFARLRTLPVDGVKIDRSFLADAATSDDARIVLRTMIELLSSLGLHTVAEGVEELDLLELLSSAGCDTAQGYGLGRPMEIHRLRAVLERAAPGYAPDGGAGEGVRHRGREHVHT